MVNKIDKILAEEIKDSRGKPTIKVTVFSNGVFDSFSVPSGASTGAHEAQVLDTDKAILNVNDIIAPVLIGQDINNQKEIDEILLQLDGTKSKTRLGGNAMIAVSIACTKAAAKAKGIEVYQHLRTLAEIKPSREVPHLYMNLINGGKHAKNNLAFQEYHVVPDIENVAEAIEIGIKIQNSIAEIILARYGEDSLVLGDEGGYAPKITDIREPLLILNEAIEKENLKGKVRLALDVAASSFYEDGLYKIGEETITKQKLAHIYQFFIEEFNLLSIEDPFAEEDFESFKILKEGNDNLLVVGDDLTVSNTERLAEAIDQNSINAMIIKPNQIGTLSETLATMKMARDNGIELIVSHRSGETMDNFIADLAYAFGCFGLKSGAPQKEERKAKYDRLIALCKANHK